MIHLTMEATVLTISVFVLILSISSLGIILLYYSCCREGEWKKYRDEGGFAVKCDNTSIRGPIAVIGK